MITGIQHFNISVSNLDEAVNFFCDFLGLEVLVPAVETDAVGLSRSTGIPDARIRVCVLKTPDNDELEITQYLQPKGRKVELKICNIGISTLAFEVDDIRQTYSDLSSRGVDFYHSPLTVESGPFKGRVACYLKGPDGKPSGFSNYPVSRSALQVKVSACAVNYQ